MQTLVADKSELTEAELARKAEMRAAKEHEARQDAEKDKEKGPIGRIYAYLREQAAAKEKRKLKAATKAAEAKATEAKKDVDINVESEATAMYVYHQLRQADELFKSGNKDNEVLADIMQAGAAKYLLDLNDPASGENYNPALYAATMAKFEEAAMSENGSDIKVDAV